jgi:hypothetical protein
LLQFQNRNNLGNRDRESERERERNNEMKLNKQERELTMEPKELLYRTVSTAITVHEL